tara:strand:- start:228 stop:395 length:168 start_codon:yes stop_codon:yes gene_type:complete
MFFNYAILPMGLALTILGTYMMYKKFEDNNNGKILGALWLFIGAMLITFYLESVF